VRARIVSSRHGLLGEWKCHHTKLETNVAKISVTPGETIDFIIDPLSNDNSDSTGWAPSIQTDDPRLAWNATSDFEPPNAAPLTRFALYAQALMMTNEFMFVD
jgi:hypothetical protein